MTLNRIIFLLFVLSIVACDSAELGAHKPKDCTAVINSYNEITVTCPDGTSLTLPPEIVTVTETVEVPVFVTVPGQCGNGNGNGNGHDNSNGNHNGHTH